MSKPHLPKPQSPFEAAEFVLHEGTVLYRVHPNRRDPTEPNPGFGSPTRFAFFSADSPDADEPAEAARSSKTLRNPVPIIYAAETAQAAIAETVLHGSVRIHGRMNAIGPASYLGLTLSQIQVRKPIRLADLTGLHAKRLGLDGTTLSAHTDYSETVLWAQAAYHAGFDGLSYMSHRCNTDRAFALFERQKNSQTSSKKAQLLDHLELESADPLDPALSPSTGFDMLVDACTASGFEVLA